MFKDECKFISRQGRGAHDRVRKSFRSRHDWIKIIEVSSLSGAQEDEQPEEHRCTSAFKG